MKDENEDEDWADYLMWRVPSNQPFPKRDFIQITNIKWLFVDNFKA
jgi:hypothetical protein